MPTTYRISLALGALALGILACSLPAASTPEAAPTAVATLAATSTPPEPTPPPEATPVLIDPCLLGVWTMDVYALNNKFLDLTGSSTMMVIAPSTATLEFRDDNVFALNSQLTLRGDMPSSGDYMELDGYHQANGSYAADGSLLSLIAVENVVDYGEMRVYIDGVLSNAPFASGPSPEIPISPPADAAYRCAGSTLEITYEGPSGTVTEEWRK